MATKVDKDDDHDAVSSSSVASNDEDDASSEESVAEELPPKKKTKTSDNSNNHNNYGPVAAAPLHIAPAFTNQAVSTNKKNSHTPIIVILDQASLETVKNKRGVYELLNCDDHRDLCKKKLRKDPNLFRPDILHQELLALLDSPLNKANLLQVYISTTKNVLIQVNPCIRMPRTYKRFAGLMVQLLHKLKIKATAQSDVLLKVVKNPVSQYLPAGTRAFGMSCQGTLYRPRALAKKLLPETASTLETTCFVIGAMSTGHVSMNDYPFIESMLSVSSYPLSGAAAIARLLSAIEDRWDVV